jgi:hypothetical protein
MSNEKIIVAVHGVGDKIGYATAWSVAYQFWRYCEQPAAIPLGRFHTELAAGGARSVPRPILITSPPSGQQLPGLGSAEVYWADIPRTVVKKGYVLEEAKRWARTIVGRYCLRSDTRVSGKGHQARNGPGRDDRDRIRARARDPPESTRKKADDRTAPANG